MEGGERIKCLELNTSSFLHCDGRFAVDYGFNIILAGDFYANYNTIILDCSKVYIGRRVLFGRESRSFSFCPPCRAVCFSSRWSDHSCTCSTLQPTYPSTLLVTVLLLLSG